MTRSILLSVFFLTAIFAVFIAVPGFSQTIDTSGLSDTFQGEVPITERITHFYEILTAILTFLVGQIMKMFGLKNKIPKVVIPITAAGLVIAGGFYSFGFVAFIPAAIAVLSMVGFFKVSKDTLKATGVIKEPAPEPVEETKRSVSFDPKQTSPFKKQ